MNNTPLPAPKVYLMEPLSRHIAEDGVRIEECLKIFMLAFCN